RDWSSDVCSSDLSILQRCLYIPDCRTHCLIHKDLLSNQTVPILVHVIHLRYLKILELHRNNKSICNDVYAFHNGQQPYVAHLNAPNTGNNGKSASLQEFSLPRPDVN